MFNNDDVIYVYNLDIQGIIPIINKDFIDITEYIPYKIQLILKNFAELIDIRSTGSGPSYCKKYKKYKEENKDISYYNYYATYGQCKQCSYCKGEKANKIVLDQFIDFITWKPLSENYLNQIVEFLTNPTHFYDKPDKIKMKYNTYPCSDLKLSWKTKETMEIKKLPLIFFS